MGLRTGRHEAARSGQSAVTLQLKERIEVAGIPGNNRAADNLNPPPIAVFSLALF